jgi:hypothetical protein
VRMTFRPVERGPGNRGAWTVRRGCNAAVVGVAERVVVAGAIGPVEGEESWKRGHLVVVVVAAAGFEYSRELCYVRVVLEAWLCPLVCRVFLVVAMRWVLGSCSSLAK